jgi:asparaginyl-tRNA synthetase
MLGRVFRLPPTIRQLLSTNISSTVEVNGWVKSVRRQKRISFAVINDGSSSSGIQAVFNDPVLAKKSVFATLLPLARAQTTQTSLTNGACVRLSGKLAKSIGAGQEKELQVESVDVLGECDPTVSTFFFTSTI